MIWFIYFAAAFGLSYIIGHAKISLSLRILLGGQAPSIHDGTGIPLPAVPPLIPVVGPFIVDLLECMACSGTWIGFASSFQLPMLLGSSPISWALVVGCATCGMNHFLSGLIYRGIRG